MTAVVRQITIRTVVDPRIIEGLGTTGIREVEVRSDRTFGVALRLRPSIRRIQFPLIVPSPINDEFKRAIDTLGRVPATIANVLSASVVHRPTRARSVD